AVKYKTRIRTRKRQSRKRWVASEAAAPELRMAVGASAATAVPVVVHTYPAAVRTTEARVVPARESGAMRRMTLEEAMKEAEFRHRDVFVFRDIDGKVKVLHRTRDGKMELI